jgi:hypothetical protein
VEQSLLFIECSQTGNESLDHKIYVIIAPALDNFNETRCKVRKALAAGISYILNVHFMTRITLQTMGSRSNLFIKALLFCCFFISVFLPQQTQAKMAPGSGECRTEIQWGLFECVQPRGVRDISFFGKVGVYNTYTCTPMDYYISAVDPITGVTNGTVTAASGPLGAGWNVITFTYVPDPGVTAVRFMITFACGGKLGYKVCRSILGEFENLDDRKLYPCRDYFKMAAPETQPTSMLIAPNPANDQGNITYTIGDRQENAVYSISVVNMMGQQVAQYTISGDSGTWQYPAAQLSTGTYIVRLLKDGNNLDVQRMIITH